MDASASVPACTLATIAACLAVWCTSIAVDMAAQPTWTAEMVACVTAMVGILVTHAQCLLIALQKSIAVAMVPHQTLTAQMDASASVPACTLATIAVCLAVWCTSIAVDMAAQPTWTAEMAACVNVLTGIPVTIAVWLHVPVAVIATVMVHPKDFGQQDVHATVNLVGLV